MGHKAKRKRAADAESFTTVSLGDPSVAAWLLGDVDDTDLVTPYTIWGISAVLRSVSVISTSIAGLPLRTYERQGDERVRIPSVFDDPYPGDEGQVPFAWVETILIHLLLWRNAYLWHEDMDSSGTVTSYRPIVPSAIELKRENGRKRFYYTEDGERKSVGVEQITHIPGPSIDAVAGHPLLYAARRIFSAALAGDNAASTALAGGIRLGALLTPGEGEDINPDEGEAILEQLRPKVLGSKNAGGIAFVNKRLKLDPWQPTNVESQWHETRMEILGEVERLFGVPPHLLADTEKQTSWGTGVAEQNRGLQVFTLKGWSDRMEQVFTRKLARGQFVEFDYKGLLQGTPAEEIELLIKQVEAGIITREEARKVMNLPPLTPSQRAALAPVTAPTPIRQEATA